MARNETDRVKEYIVEHYRPDNYKKAPSKDAEFKDIANFILYTMREEKKYDYYSSEGRRFIEWCKGLPSVLDTSYYIGGKAWSDLDWLTERSDGWFERRITADEAAYLVTSEIYKALTGGDLRTMYDVYDLDNGTIHEFVAWTPYDAMKKMLYTLNQSHYDEDAKIEVTYSGNCLYINHCGKTYSIINEKI